MAVKTFSTAVQFKELIKVPIKKALMATARRMTEELRNTVDKQYYQDPLFYPNIYRRSYKFLDAASYDLIGENLAEIGIDTDLMNYYNGFDADAVVDYAAHSMHGSELYQTDTEDFWTVYLEWCNNNVIPIFIEELQNQGLQISR